MTHNILYDESLLQVIPQAQKQVPFLPRIPLNHSQSTSPSAAISMARKLSTCPVSYVFSMLQPRCNFVASISGCNLQVAIVRACGRQLIEELAIGGEPSVLAQKVRLADQNTKFCWSQRCEEMSGKHFDSLLILEASWRLFGSCSVSCCNLGSCADRCSYFSCRGSNCSCRWPHAGAAPCPAGCSRAPST